MIYKLEKPLQRFILRFKFFRDLNSIEITHTIVVLSKESIEGIGISYQLPLKGELWNRQVRIAGDTGVYCEPAQLLLSRRFTNENDLYRKQIDGKMIAYCSDQEDLFAQAEGNAVFNNYYLEQSAHDHYNISKQMNHNYTEIQIGEGNRSHGLMYVGGENGGVSCSIRDFWQKNPAMLEVVNLAESTATCTAWLWSPRSKKMDFRHYSARDHMASAYEGMEEIRSTPVGIANTSMIWLDLFTNVPSNEELWLRAVDHQKPAQIVATPEIYHDSKVFGIWSLPQKNTKVQIFLEKQLETLIQFYKKEVEQRGWYGYWNYGDFMHTYDPYRHVWRYDLGGFAWQNTELVPNIWLWQYFLRTGDETTYYLAEAMTRHTSEVDQYHEGEYKGLGSRHNVLHWGDQAKEARISMAGLHRYYYFLTGDERTREIIEAVKDNDEYIFNELPPLREFYDVKQSAEKIPIRTGPDWSAVVSNWFSAWEMTGDKKFLNNILTGIQSIEKSPLQLLSGPAFSYDPKTKKLHLMDNLGVGEFHMMISFGAPQIWMELAQNIECGSWSKMLADFGYFYSLSETEKRIKSKDQLTEKQFSWPIFATGMMAYGARYYKEGNFAKKIWTILLDKEKSGVPLPIEDTIKKVENWKDMDEMSWLSTNTASQWSINVMLCLELIGDFLPEEIEMYLS